MKRISSMVIIKKVDDVGGKYWKAFFRGTNNRVCRDNGQLVMARTRRSDLTFDLLNNPMERGVVIE